MLNLVAKELFLTRGIGVHEDKLTSFEYALRDAGIAGTNIVLISSIFPPKAKLIPKKEGLKKIKPGQILFTIYSRNQTNEPHRMISASVGLALPKDRTRYGYLSEYDAFGQNENKQAIMLKILQHKCLHHHLVYLLILTRAGMKKDNNGQFLEKFINLKTLQ